MSERDDTPNTGPGHSGGFDPGHTPEEVEARTGNEYEKTDVPSTPLITFMISVLVFLGIITVVIGGFGYLLFERNKRVNRPPSELSTRPVIPPEPRLQSSPKADMDRMLAEENDLLTSYTLVNRQAGIVRIPIDRAITLLSERGLPPRRHDIPTTAAAAATTTATAASSPAGRATAPAAPAPAPPARPAPAAKRQNTSSTSSMTGQVR